MIIFLYGQDTYRSRQKLNEIIEHYKKIHRSGLNFKYFDGEKLNFQDFKNEVQSVSMFSEKKLIILENIIKNKDFKEKFLANSKKFLGSENIILFYETEEITEKDPLFKFLIKNAKSQEFKSLEGQRLKSWIKKEFSNYQTEITSEALEKLIEFVGNDLWQLSNEIKKLVNYKPKQRIEVKDIELLVRPKFENDIFLTIDAIAGKNKKKALKLIHQHLEKGDSPLYLLSMINFQFRNLLIMKSGELGHELYANYIPIPGMHPYVIRKTKQQIKKFTLEELKKIYQKIFQIDLAIKTGKIDPQTALDMFVAEI